MLDIDSVDILPSLSVDDTDLYTDHLSAERDLFGQQP